MKNKFLAAFILLIHSALVGAQPIDHPVSCGKDDNDNVICALNEPFTIITAEGKKINFQLYADQHNEVNGSPKSLIVMYEDEKAILSDFKFYIDNDNQPIEQTTTGKKETIPENASLEEAEEIIKRNLEEVKKLTKEQFVEQNIPRLSSENIQKLIAAKKLTFQAEYPNSHSTSRADRIVKLSGKVSEESVKSLRLLLAELEHATK